MTEQEAIEVITEALEQSENIIVELTNIKEIAERQQKVGEYYANLENCVKEMDACKVAIKALEEVEQYRAIGTVNEFKSLKEDWLNKFDRLIEYRKIGTPEECRAAVEKLRKVEEVVKEWDKVGYAYSNNHMCEIKMIVKGVGVDE